MSIGYWVKCDLCGKKTDDWPEGGNSFDGWAQVTDGSKRSDYCEECVKKMLKAAELERQP